MKENNQEKELQWKVFVTFLATIAKEKKFSNYKIAKETGYSESTIGRIFKLEFCPKLQIFLDIARVLEINIFFEDRGSTTELNILFEKTMEELGRRKPKS